MSKRDCSVGRPSTVQDALKILCRQCSEFAWANIMSSASVGSRPSAPNRSHSQRTSSSLSASPSRRSASRRARCGSGPREIRPSGPAGASWKRSAGTARSRGGAGGRAPGSPSAGSTERRSVMRSYNAPSAGAAVPSLPETTQRVPRSTRRTRSRPQLRTMSVALLDHGDIVPVRGMTSARMLPDRSRYRVRTARDGMNPDGSPIVFARRFASAPEARSAVRSAARAGAEAPSRRESRARSSSWRGEDESTKYAAHAATPVTAGRSWRNRASVFPKRKLGSAAQPGR